MRLALVDANFLIALYSLRDKFHVRAAEFAASVSLSFIYPQVILPEVVYNLQERGGTQLKQAFLNDFPSRASNIQPIEQADLVRVAAIMTQYQSANFDFVDCCLMALAERLNITQIVTFDRRDFSIFRPTHCPYYDLLP
jgi:uncharacterized protein